MGWWAAAAFTLNCQKLWNKGGHDLSWRWWPQTILSTNLIEVMLLHWCKKMRKHTNLRTENEDDEEAVDCDTSGAPTPMAPFFLASAELGQTLPPADFFPPGMSLNPTLQVRPLSKRGTTRLWHRPLLHTEIEYSPWPGFATSLGGKGWDKPMEDCCWACARHHFIWPYRQASLEEGTTSLTPWRQGNCEAQTLQCCLEAELKTSTKIWVKLLTHLDRALSRMSWTSICNPYTLDTGITTPSESGREEIVSTRATWGEQWATLCWECHEQQHQCQSEILIDSDQPSYWQESR